MTVLNALSMVMENFPFFRVCRKLRDILRSPGKRTRRGSGDHHRMGESSENHGKIPSE
jgi:hypothetical protein